MNAGWMLIRGSGVVAFLLLAVSVIWGLLLTTKLLGGLAKAKPLTWFHESLAVGAILATIVHIVALSIHDFVKFDWEDILIPGHSDWSPVAVAFGVVGFYAMTLISLSFYAKKFIGLRAWRAIHFGSFGVFLSVALHGILAGTDGSAPWMIAMYAASLALVVILMLIRLGKQSEPKGAPPSRNRVHEAIQNAVKETSRGA